MNNIKSREWLLAKYAKEWAAYPDEVDARQLDCMNTILDAGMTEASFIGHVIGCDAEKQFLETAKHAGELK